MMAENSEIPIIWQDDHLLVINKPAGLLALADGYNSSLPHVKTALPAHLGPLWIVHRLDRFTSGVMVLARNASVHRQLNTQFQDRKVKKVYIALVEGVPDWEQKVCTQPLRENMGRKHRTIVDQLHGKPSVTRLKVLERFPGCSLIEANPETGRRHQVRVHLACEGFPIACDNLYGSGLNIFQAVDWAAMDQVGMQILERPGLHALSIEFIHPETGKPSHFDAGYPGDFTLTLKLLRGNNPAS